ncbi:hypothetical protein VBD025_17480 [Virgibacillus flavescens]|uniref:hypothetical protein n=1 Tax=Virgibacillus flavescens TaxID=1611422 RepID=UPI003D348151
MSIFYLIYALFVIFIFNSLTHQFCLKMELNQKKQSTVYRTINMMIMVLLITSYIRVLNEIT